MKLALGSVVAACAVGTVAQFAVAAPYASGVSIAGTTVSFTLNEAADSLFYSLNGGAPVALDGSSKGTKTFTLTSPTDTFAITANKNDSVGYRIKTGSATSGPVANGLSVATDYAGYRAISDDTNVLGRFNSPRGVAVNNNPNAGTNFGTAYIANSAAGSIAANTTTIPGAPARTLGDGIYAIRADQSDRFGYGDSAQNPGNLFGSGSSSSPFRTTVGSDGNVYVADFSDTNGNVYQLSANLTSGTNTFTTIGGPSSVPAGQNHGSTTAVFVTGSTATGNLTVYTLDEDLTFSQFDGGTNTGKNNLWRYDIGSGSTPFNGTPTRINQTNVLLTAATSDLDVGADGKFYLAQNRSGGGEAGITVLGTDGAVIFDSLTASRALLADPGAIDIFRNVQGIDVSDDQKYLAVVLNNSDLSVIPLVNGVPDIANRVLVDTGTDVASGRDIAFDAAGNLYYVSSGQGILRMLAPGGQTSFTTSFDGTNFAFGTAQVIPEPTTLAAIAGLGGLMLRRRRA